MEGEDMSQVPLKEFSTTSDIIANDDAFHPDAHRPLDLPERKDELEDVHAVLGPAIRDSTPKNAFVYGKPGQGKTAAIRLKLDQLEYTAEQNDEVGDIESIYIPCNANNRSYHAVNAILNKLEGSDTSPAGLPLEQLYQRMYEYMNENGGTYIIVLDEVDKIQDDDGDSSRPNIFYELPRAQMNDRLDDGVRLSIIGISNNRRFKQNLSMDIKDALYDESIDFHPYTKEELEAILMRRAEKGLMDTEVVKENGEEFDRSPNTREERESVIGHIKDDSKPDPVFDSDLISRKVVQMCAEYAAHERGSARQAIEFLGKAANIAHDRNADAIREEHVHEAENVLRRNYILDTFHDFSEQDILTLFAILYAEAEGQTPARTGVIYEQYETVTESLDKRTLGQRRVRDRMIGIDNAGIISMEKETGGSRGGERWETELAIELGEAIQTLQEDDDFYEEYGDIIDEIEMMTND